MAAADTPRWLDTQEQETWTQLATMILRLQPVLSAQLQREFGISHFEYLILARLSEAPGSMVRMSVLATTTGSSLPRLSQTVGRLEKRGWVSRRPDADDGRYTVALLNPAGRRQLEKAAPAHVADVRRYVFDRLTQAQVRQLGSICQRIVDGLPPDDSWPGAAEPANPKSARGTRRDPLPTIG